MAQEESDADVIVVGGGGTGLATALAAARLGRRVLLLEKGQSLGGTTALSVGSITASCTPHQAAAKVDDDPQGHYEDMGVIAGDEAHRDNLALRRLYVEQVPETIRFLMDLGITLIGPMPEPPHRKPRMHVIVPHARGYIHHMSRHCRREGVNLVTDARVETLTRDGDRVTGVEALVNGQRRRFTAQRGVVLTSGDFSSGAELKERFVPPDFRTIRGINPESTGDGQRMALAAGATVVNEDMIWGPEIRFVPPPGRSLVTRLPPYRFIARLIRRAMKTMPDALMRPFLMGFVTTYLAPSTTLFDKGAILVNRQGRRFCDERDHPELAIPDQPEGDAYILLDGDLAKAFDAWPNFISTAPGVAYAYLSDYARNRADVCHRADDLNTLASRLGMDNGALREAFARPLGAASGGDANGPAKPPYYALGPVRSWILVTEGGVAVNERLEALDADGRPIPGLFAAGSAGQGGLMLGGHGHHLGWAFTSGRIAGRNAAFSPKHTAEDSSSSNRA